MTNSGTKLRGAAALRRLAALALFLAATPALAGVPTLMNNQGLLQTQGGAPVADGVYDLTFSLYPTLSAPTPAWTEKVPKVAVQNGFYSAVLGQGTPFPADLFRTYTDLWLGVKVDTGNELPRARILTLAYAFEADHALLATTAEGLTCTGCVPDKALGFDLCLATASCKVALSDLTCTAGQFPRFVGGKWTCDVEKTVDQATVQNWSKLVCYDTPTELRAALDTVYAPLVHKHAGADITSAVNQAREAANALALEGKSLAQVIQAVQDAVAAAGYLKKTDRIDVSGGLIVTGGSTGDATVQFNTSPTRPPASAGSVSFGYTGGAQSFVVPNGVYSINIDARGAGGGNGGYFFAGANNGGGKGARLLTTLYTAPGTPYYIFIGGAGGSSEDGSGTGGFNGGGTGGVGRSDHGGSGGGGGASDIRQGGNTRSDIIVVAGGGGGGGGSISNGFSSVFYGGGGRWTKRD